MKSSQKPLFFNLSLLASLASVSAADLQVTSASDSGAGSLRQTILDANSSTEADVITFADSLRDQTITLTGDELVITGELEIVGFPDSSLIISGGDTRNLISIPDGGIVRLRDLTLSNGLTEGRGAGIFNSGNLTVTNCLFRDHSAAVGAAIANFEGVLSVSLCRFEDNFATDDGAGIDSFGAATIDRCFFTRNRVDKNGGALAGFGPTSVSNSTFTDNSAEMNGGAIFNGNEMRLMNCTLDNNRAEDNGGACENRGAPFSLVNCTVSQNRATNGGGLSSRFTLELIQSTIASNTASGTGGGIFFQVSGDLRFSNSIVANNSSPEVERVGGNVLFSGLTLLSDDSLPSSGSLVNETDPLLGPLQDNEGSVMTHALLPGSPAIDRGDNSSAVDALFNPLMLDSRGAPRILRALPTSAEATVDLGSYEAIPAVSMQFIFNNSNQPEVRVQGLPGTSYNLFRSVETLSDFLSLESFTLDEGGEFVVMDSSTPLPSAAFYRLQITQ